MDEVLKDFLVESYENLDRLDRALVELEKDPRHRESWNSIFRTIHTIKGTCGFFGFSKLERVTHVGENLLSRLREGTLTLNPEITSALLAMLDAVRKVLAIIESTQQEGDEEYPELIETLTRLCASEARPAPAASKPSATTVLAPAPLPPQPPSVSPVSIPHVSPAPSSIVATPTVAPAPLAAALIPAAVPASASAAPLPNGGASKETGAATLPAVESAGPVPVASSVSETASGSAESAESRIADTTIRVDVSLLDKLMNLVGELVLARNQILQFSSTQKDSVFVGTSQRLNLITTELQEGVMKTRMQPIGNVWNKFPRVVRDLALACEKQVRVEMQGKETELDKTIIEAIKDPLTHLVRNSVDHGIEDPLTRAAAGKPAEGCLSLRAYHEGGQVNIEISDDGAGIDPDKIKNSAIKRGVITAEDAARMSDRESVNLIFLPGLSTAAKITKVSGRGVGMDVVKTNIEKISGTVDVQSKLGEGTTIKIKIPLTLAIIPALIVTSGGDRYAIPQVSLLELVRLEGEEAKHGVEMISGTPVYRLRGNLLPVIYLGQILQTEPKRTGPARGCDANDVVNIVVLKADQHQFGLVVEGINDTEEIVVKPLGKQLKGLSAFAGSTIMGDGKVALILDIMGIAQKANVVSEGKERAVAEKEARSTDQADTRKSLLLFGATKDDRMAIPLSLVARLEEFPRSAVERANSRDVVQYRGQIMPLVQLSKALYPNSPAQAAASETMQVVVYAHNGRSVGLVVDRIIDIVQEAISVQRQSNSPGIFGSAVIQQRVTDLLDVEGLIRSTEPGFFEQTTTA